MRNQGRTHLNTSYRSLALLWNAQLGLQYFAFF